jgi:hypothetical protein
MNLNLEVAKVNFVLQVLGQLPTNSNVYPLLKKIEAQAIEQTPSENKDGDN